MSHQLTVARPYAKAVFSVAQAGQHLQAWSDTLQVLAYLAKERDVQTVIVGPNLTNVQRKDLLLQLVKSVLPQNMLPPLAKVENFIGLLVEEKRVLALPDIARLYQQLMHEQQGTFAAQVASAYPLAEAQRAAIKRGLEQRFNAQVALHYTIDEALIGGVVIRAGNWVIDGTVKSKLVQLAADLNSAH